MQHVHNANCQHSVPASAPTSASASTQTQTQIERQLREMDNLNYNQVGVKARTNEGGVWRWMWRRIQARSVSNSFGWHRVRLEFMDGVRPSVTTH